MEQKKYDKYTYPPLSRNNHRNLKGGLYNAILV